MLSMFSLTKLNILMAFMFSVQHAREAAKQGREHRLKVIDMLPSKKIEPQMHNSSELYNLKVKKLKSSKYSTIQGDA